MPARYVFRLLLPLVLVSSAYGQSTNDGRLFDQGRSMSVRSERAPDGLDELNNYLGQWDVEITTRPTDSTMYTTTGQAELSLMNRGWSLMERLRVDDFDGLGHANHAMSFLCYNPTSERYELGEASSFTEHIAVYGGDVVNGELVLTSAAQRLGGSTVTMFRVTYSGVADEAFTVLLEESVDVGQTWKPSLRKVYSRREADDGFMAVRDDYGTPSSVQPDEARQLDFLLGEWTANHNIFLGGNWIQYPTTTTAVFVLEGHAILEHSWFSLDPNHPEAATSIIRLYNRAERRWESLYLNNRGNSLLHFGGNWEDDRMILHNFDTNLTDTISRWVFHTIEPDRYQWFAESSSDRGATFNETWTIDVVRE